MSVKNFVQCGLVTPVAANTTELVLMAPTASYQYPPLDGGTLVIADSVARPSFYEIISYTHRIENVLYGVVRAKEGTTARAWSGVTWIYQALTAQDYVDALALKAALESPALTGTPTAPTAPLGVNTNQIATMAALKAAIDNLVGGAPGTLDALNELAAALGNDPNFATTMTNALAGKEPSIAAGTSAQMWLGNKTWASVLSQVQGTLLTGLGVGANTPIVSTDTLIGALAKLQNQLNNKANFTDSRLSDAREWTATEVSQAEAQAGTATIPRKWSALRVWQAVLASSLTGLNLTVGTAVAASDTVLVAIGKLQKQITDAASNLAGSVRATVLTGYVSGSNAVLTSTDTVLAAFGKLQAQITGLATSKLDASANAVSATKLQTARTINGVSFDGSANITVADATKEPAIPAGTTAQYVAGNKTLRTFAADVQNTMLPAANTWSAKQTYSSGLDSVGTVALANGTIDSPELLFATPSYTVHIDVAGDNFRAFAAGVSYPLAFPFVFNLATKRAYFFDNEAWHAGNFNPNNYLPATGNAATATKLQTARTINGVAFDGTANITVADATKLPLTGGTLTGPLYGTRGIFTGTGNDWYLGGLEVVGNGPSNTVFPTIGFHQPGMYASYLQLCGGSDFRFYAQGGTSYANVTAAAFYGSGAGLTELNASNLSTGTVPDARLSGTHLASRVTALEGIGKLFTKEYVSAEQTLTAGGGLTLAHGLGTKPKLVAAAFICKAADAGYSPGDEFHDALTYAYTDAGYSVTTTASYDTSYIYVSFESAVGNMRVKHKSTGAITNMVLENWRLIVRAWA